MLAGESRVERNEDTEADVRAGKEVKAEHKQLQTLWMEIHQEAINILPKTASPSPPTGQQMSSAVNFLEQNWLYPNWSVFSVHILFVYR